MRHSSPSVTTTYPGADPATVEAKVTRPIEDAIATLGRIRRSFADLDGYIWNVGYSAQGKNQPYAE